MRAVGSSAAKARVVDFSMGSSGSMKSPSLVSGGKGHPGYQDPEADGLLAPGMTRGENLLRWGFIRKVYGIVAAQLVLTTVVCGTMMSNPSLLEFLKANPLVHFLVMVGSFAALFVLFVYKDRHPLNLGILAVWTALLSVTVGTACSLYAPAIVFQGLFLTSGVVIGLTAYTFWAVRRGHDFTHWGTYLFTTLWAFFLFGFMQIFLPVSNTTRAIYAFLGTLLFSGYLIYDTNMLITKHSVDEYIWASVELYLDMINLFLYILEILNRSRN